MNCLDEIIKHKIVAIVRGADPKQTLVIAKALYEGGIRMMEITFNSLDPLSVIKDLSKNMSGKMLIGAGTILDPESALAAITAGAKFIISPTLNANTIEMTRRHGAVSIPGAYTPTEILTAYSCGGDIIKVFPAASNPNYLKEIKGPLPHIPIMPTGGINVSNIRDFRDAGAVAFGIGSALVNTRETVTDDYLKQLTVSAKLLYKAITE